MGALVVETLAAVILAVSEVEDTVCMVYVFVMAL